ncbi:MAG: TMEM165/GDT1 family protein [Deltaproteobacteria bacterium]|nr:TMEM165/GDT1 family protein [Deltaproteobacteria bacterium]
MMDLIAIAQAGFLVGLAELGDKSQLVLLTLATRYSAAPVLLGAVAAFAVLNAVAAVFGGVLSAAVDPLWVDLGAGLLFLFFGLSALLRPPQEEEEGGARPKLRSPLLLAFAMVFVAELGDKTQFTVAGLASITTPLDAWIGATLGLALTTALVTLTSRSLVERVPKKTLFTLSGALFAGVGLWTLAAAAMR